MEIAEGRVELRLLLGRERYEREVRRQREVGKGPERSESGRLMEVTAAVRLLQRMPVQLQGVGSRGFQLEREFEGSERRSLA